MGMRFVGRKLFRTNAPSNNKIGPFMVFNNCGKQNRVATICVYALDHATPCHQLGCLLPSLAKAHLREWLD